MSEYDKILNVEDIEGYLINRYAGSQNGINNKKDAHNSGPLNLIEIVIPFKVWFKSRIASNTKAYIISPLSKIAPISDIINIYINVVI